MLVNDKIMTGGLTVASLIPFKTRVYVGWDGLGLGEIAVGRTPTWLTPIEGIWAPRVQTYS